MEELNTQTIAEKYNISPSHGLLIYPEDIEKDDWLHNPDVNEEDMEICSIWSSRGVLNCAGLLLIVLGILTLFIGYPVLLVC
jgi:beta-glucan synthesis-associated protein KRE6